jgi:hypothetical protein
VLIPTCVLIVPCADPWACPNGTNLMPPLAVAAGLPCLITTALPSDLASASSASEQLYLQCLYPHLQIHQRCKANAQTSLFKEIGKYSAITFDSTSRFDKNERTVRNYAREHIRSHMLLDRGAKRCNYFSHKICHKIPPIGITMSVVVEARSLHRHEIEISRTPAFLSRFCEILI